MNQESKLTKQRMRIEVNSELHLNIFMLSDIINISYKVLYKTIKKSI